MTDVVYSQFPISESDFDQLVDFAQLCGYHEEFSEAFKTAVDGSIPLCNGSWQADHTRLKIFSHDACFDHIPLPHGGDLNAMKKFKLFFKYPENPSRLHCLTSKTSGILRSISFQNVPWDMHPPPATMADILRVHDWTYVHHILSILRYKIFRQTDRETERIKKEKLTATPLSRFLETIHSALRCCVTQKRVLHPVARCATFRRNAGSSTRVVKHASCCQSYSR